MYNFHLICYFTYIYVTYIYTYIYIYLYIYIYTYIDCLSIADRYGPAAPHVLGPLWGALGGRPPGPSDGYVFVLMISVFTHVWRETQRHLKWQLIFVLSSHTDNPSPAFCKKDCICIKNWFEVLEKTFEIAVT